MFHAAMIVLRNGRFISTYQTSTKPSFTVWFAGAMKTVSALYIRVNCVQKLGLYTASSQNELKFSTKMEIKAGLLS